MKGTPSLLGRHPDLDDVELLKAIETAFNIHVTNAEAEQLFTVGDLYDLVLGKLNHAERGDLHCPTATAFRQLKRAIEATHPGVLVSPSTQLAPLVERVGPRRWFRDLQARSELRLPVLDLSCLSTLFELVLFLWPLTLFPAFGSQALLGWIVAVPLAYVLARLLPVALPNHYRTIGDLARITAAMNMGRLFSSAEVIRTLDVWKALEAIVREETGWDQPLGRELRLIG